MSHSLEPLPRHQVRYYQETGKSLEKCASHGAGHATYGWSRQIDPRWSDAQRQAYLEAYATHKKVTP